jgi:hypothetical protein
LENPGAAYSNHSYQLRVAARGKGIGKPWPTLRRDRERGTRKNDIMIALSLDMMS